MTAGEQAFLVLAIGPNPIVSPEILALPLMILQPPVPDTAPSAPSSRIVCRRSMTPPPRMFSASQRPAGLPDGVCAKPAALVAASKMTDQKCLRGFFNSLSSSVTIADDLTRP